MKISLTDYCEKYGSDSAEAANGILNERRPIEFRPVASLGYLLSSIGRCCHLMPSLQERIVLEIELGSLASQDELTILGQAVGADRVREIFPGNPAAWLDGVALDITGFDSLHQRLQMMPDYDQAVERTIR